jgi:hypothetical protein
MVTKRRNLNEEIARGMDGRSIGESPADQTAGEVTPVTQNTTRVTQNTTAETQNAAKDYKSNIVSIRFDEGDYERLKEIAREQGTNGAAIIRKAVKDAIKAAGKP